VDSTDKVAVPVALSQRFKRDIGSTDTHWWESVFKAQ